MTEVLTEQEESYLQKLFAEHHKTIELKLHEELKILSKYKGELARNYESAAKHHNTLIGCMKDIIEKQEELIGLCRHLGGLAARIENYFLQDVKDSQDEQEETKLEVPYDSPIDKNITIEDFFRDVRTSCIDGVLVEYIIEAHCASLNHVDLGRTALISSGITHLYMLDGKSITQIRGMIGMGPQAAAIIIFLAELKGLKIFYGKITDHISTHYFLNKLKGNDDTKIGDLQNG
jgi:hypothetical protein